MAWFVVYKRRPCCAFKVLETDGDKTFGDLEKVVAKKENVPAGSLALFTVETSTPEQAVAAARKANYHCVSKKKIAEMICLSAGAPRPRLRTPFVLRSRLQHN